MEEFLQPRVKGRETGSVRHKQIFVSMSRGAAGALVLENPNISDKQIYTNAAFSKWPDIIVFKSI